MIINLASRSGAWAAGQAQFELERQGAIVRECHRVGTCADLLAAAQGAIDRGCRTLAVGGGDGTISAVVDLLAYRPELTLGVLPIGTGNEVARVLGIPLDLPGACRVIAYGQERTVDLAVANGDYFLHTALIGYPAHVNHNVPPWLKFLFGKAAYIHSVLGSIIGTTPFDVRVTTSAGHWEGRTVVVIVGNSQFHLPARVLLPDQQVHQSGLTVYTPVDTSLSTLTRLAVGLWITRRQQPALLFASSGEEIVIEADPPQVVDLDGEFAHTTPLSLRLARGALRVLVPITEPMGPT